MSRGDDNRLRVHLPSYYAGESLLELSQITATSCANLDAEPREESRKRFMAAKFDTDCDVP